MGLDLSKGTVRNNLEAGVIEPAMSKVKIIQVSSSKTGKLVFCYSFWSILLDSILTVETFPWTQFATEAAITILRIDDMIKLVKDESQNEEN